MFGIGVVCFLTTSKGAHWIEFQRVVGPDLSLEASDGVQTTLNLEYSFGFSDRRGNSRRRLLLWVTLYKGLVVGVFRVVKRK